MKRATKRKRSTASVQLRCALVIATAKLARSSFESASCVRAAQISPTTSYTRLRADRTRPSAHESATCACGDIQHWSGGRSLLLGISKRGDRYLRTLLIHGTRATLRFAARKRDPRSRWISAMRERRGTNIAAAALANKNARVLWALLAHNQDYRVRAAA
jgi:transposase